MGKTTWLWMHYQLPADDDLVMEPHLVWSSGVSATFLISTDTSVLHTIKSGYGSDPFCQKLGKVNVPGAKLINCLWYIRNHFLIMRVGNVQEQLYRLGHDTLGHFGFDKSYGTLKDSYYWPNM